MMLSVALFFVWTSMHTSAYPHPQTFRTAENIGSSTLPAYLSQKPSGSDDLTTELAISSRLSTADPIQPVEGPSTIYVSDATDPNTISGCKSLNTRDLEIETSRRLDQDLVAEEDNSRPSICPLQRELTPEWKRQRESEARKKASAAFDPDFDCSKMDEATDPAVKRNPLYRFCCTNGPPAARSYHQVVTANQAFVAAKPDIRRGCILYNHLDPKCFNIENRVCGFCKSPDHFVFDSFHPFNKDDLPNEELPDHYIESPKHVRHISPDERKQRGHEYWDGPSGRILTGHRYTHETTCSPQYLDSRGYSAVKTRRQRAPGYNEQDRKKSEAIDGSGQQLAVTTSDEEAEQQTTATIDNVSEQAAVNLNDGSGSQVLAAPQVDDPNEQTTFLPTDSLDLTST